MRYDSANFPRVRFTKSGSQPRLTAAPQGPTHPPSLPTLGVKPLPPPPFPGAVWTMEATGRRASTGKGNNPSFTVQFSFTVTVRDESSDIRGQNNLLRLPNPGPQSLISLWFLRTLSTMFTYFHPGPFRVEELCESRGGRPGLSVLMSLTVSVDVKQH